MSVYYMREKMERIYQLDGLRFVMIFIIFMGHCFSHFLCNYSYGWMKTFFSTGFAVDYFFILSGFGIYLNNYNKQVDYTNINLIFSLKYAINKIRKIYPVYVFSMLLYAPFQFSRYFMIIFLISLTLLQSLAFNGSIFHGINGVSWFLSSLFVAYIFCPYFYKIGSSKKISFLLTIDLLAIWIISYITFAYTDVGFPVYKNVMFTLGQMAPFIPSCFDVLFGMLMARIYIKYKDTSFKNIYAYVVTAVCVCFQLFMGEAIKVLGYTVLSVPTIILCGCFILTISLNTENTIAKIFKTNTMLTLGKYTMYIFLLHYPALFVAEKIFEYYDIYYGDITGVIELLCVVVLTYLLIKVYLMMEAFIIIVKNKRLA